MSNLKQTMENAIRFQAEGNLLPAQELYERILKQDPTQHIARHNLGIVLLEQKKFKSAISHLSEALLLDRRNPQTTSTYRNVGLKLFYANLWESALPWLKEALQRNPSDQETRHAINRALPRTHLKPEIHDIGSNKVRLRYSPREASEFVYAIDIVGTCNLKCPTCPVGNSRNVKRPKGFMELDLFSKILDKIEQDSACNKPQIWLYSWGEPLLHPRLTDFIQLAKTKGMSVHLSTNLNVKIDLFSLIKSAPDEIKISISGFDPDSYKRLHAGGNLELLKTNLKTLASHNSSSTTPTRIWIGHHIYKTTEKYIPEIQNLCQQYSLEYVAIPAFYQPLERLLELITSPINPPPVMDEMLEHPKQYIARMRKQKSGKYDCELRFNQMAINFDGSVALCCSVYDTENMLNAMFLDHPHEELQAMKYLHPFCAICYKQGLAYTAPKLFDF